MNKDRRNNRRNFISYFMAVWNPGYKLSQLKNYVRMNEFYRFGEQQSVYFKGR